MKKLITTDGNRCIGCRMCEIACSFHFTSSSRPAAARLTVVRLEGHGLHLPQVCRQCAEPLCAAVCPVDALARDPATGAMQRIASRCIGCRMCLQACPFGSMGVDPETEEMIKCELCGGDPPCIKSCPTKAIAFEAPTQPAARRRRAHALRTAEGTIDG
ncbi:MAG: 4Fe-4S dicluster domain-containing protein [Planctomycetota bacterium]|jgi:Fe-S-cluster-containing hydrogenase component 2